MASIKIQGRDLDNSNGNILKAIGASDASNHQLKTYTSLAQIGITIGEETIDSIMAALPNNSMLIFYITSEYNTSQYPTVAATCIIYKSLESRTSLTIEGANTGRRWFAEHYTANGNITWTGWKEIFTTESEVLKSKSLLLDAGTGQLYSDGNALVLNSLDNQRDWNNSRRVQVANATYSSNIAYALQLIDCINGAYDVYNIFGEHNKDLLKSVIQEMIANGEIQTGGESVIRQITRGTASVNGDLTISCNITDPSKVVVLLNPNGSIATATDETQYASHSGAGAGNVYLKSVSTSGITVSGFGITSDGWSGDTYLTSGSITFSYQIIEYM